MVRDLKVVLTDEELLRKGAEMADIQRKKELKEEEKKSTAKALGVEIEAFEKKQSELAIAIRDKSEMRSIVCRVEKDFIHKENLVIRSDTGEVIERHPMTASDLQTKLPIKEELPKDKNEEPKDNTEKTDDGSNGSIPTPAGFPDADVGQIWRSEKLKGEVKVIAKAESSIVIELEGGGSTRVFADTWAMFELSFVRFCDRHSNESQSIESEPIALLEAATPPLAPKQTWAIHGYEVIVESINEAERTILVHYPHDDSNSFFSFDEWETNARFVRSESADETKSDKPKRKRGKKAA